MLNRHREIMLGLSQKLTLQSYFMYTTLFKHRPTWETISDVPENTNKTHLEMCFRPTYHIWMKLALYRKFKIWPWDDLEVTLEWPWNEKTVLQLKNCCFLNGFVKYVIKERNKKKVWPNRLKTNEFTGNLSLTLGIRGKPP